MPSLCHPSNRDKFLLRLGACEYAAGSRNEFSEHEERFIADMRRLYNQRDDNSDVGMTPWSPTVSQWNWLGSLYERATR